MYFWRALQAILLLLAGYVLKVKLKFGEYFMNVCPC
jgi:hypothetical protein